jgi:hypothetical protein
LSRNLWLGLVLAALSTGDAVGQVPVDRPQLLAGDRWSFRTTDLQKNEELETYEFLVTGVPGDDIDLARTILSAKNSGDAGKRGVRKADASTWTFANAALLEGTYVAFAFALDVGKMWEYDYRYRNADGGDPAATRIKAKVEGWEEVAVPAGKFRTLKVVHEGTWTRTIAGIYYSGIIRETFWYAPEAKWYAKREYQSRRSNGMTDASVRNELVAVELKR